VDTSVGGEYDYEPTATDPEGEDVTIELVDGPIGMTHTGGKLSWRPTASQVGVHTIRLSASDGINTVYQDFEITVAPGTSPADDDDVEDPKSTSSTVLWIVLAILGIIAVVIIVVVAVVLMRRKKPEETEQLTPGEVLDAEVESADIFKQKEGRAFAAQQTQSMAPQMAPPMAEVPMVDEVPLTQEVPPVDETEQMGSPEVSAQLPPARVQGMEASAPDEEIPADMDDPYGVDLSDSDPSGVKQLKPADDDGV
jgi:hypothetical protein